MKSKMCESCPFNCTPSAIEASNLGCLPDNAEVRRMYREESKVWMCHSNEDRVCQGLKEDLKEQSNEELKTNGKIIQTYKNWYHGDD